MHNRWIAAPLQQHKTTRVVTMEKLLCASRDMHHINTYEPASSSLCTTVLHLLLHLSATGTPTEGATLCRLPTGQLHGHTHCISANVTDAATRSCSIQPLIQLHAPALSHSCRLQTASYSLVLHQTRLQNCNHHAHTASRHSTRSQHVAHCCSFRPMASQHPRHPPGLHLPPTAHTPAYWHVAPGSLLAMWLPLLRSKLTPSTSARQAAKLPTRVGVPAAEAVALVGVAGALYSTAKKTSLAGNAGYKPGTHFSSCQVAAILL